MKVLVLYIDMLGGEYINICNNKAEETSFDRLIRNIGGKVYTNSYTPAPDTPRSSACIWSGVYPKENHCTVRVKWPKICINTNIDNLWKILNDSNYRVNIYMSSSDDLLGLIPLYGSEYIYKESIYQFMENAEITENSFNFMYLLDVHHILGETRYDGIQEASDFLTDIIEQIFEYYGGVDYFDYIMMFSDHGFQQCKEERLLSRTRAHTFIYERNKKEKTMCYDSKLRSNLDIFPTLCEKLGFQIKNNIDGKSLSTIQGHKYILMEDMEGFTTNISQTIEHWGVIRDNGDMHWIDCDGVWKHSDIFEKFDEEFYLNMIKQKMTKYSENQKMYLTASIYDNYAKTFRITENYSTGEKLVKMMFEYSDISELIGKKILLYGAGKVGIDYYKQFTENECCYVLGWIDLNYIELKQKVDGSIIGINGIFDLEYDYIIIAIEKYNVAKSISQMLVDLGIDKNKIIWKDPKLKRVKREIYEALENNEL